MTKILLVDDARLVLELERSFLKRSGCDLATATTGAEALEKARILRPDLILLDADLPGTDGVACCRSIKSDPDLSATPVVFADFDPGMGQGEHLAEQVGDLSLRLSIAFSRALVSYQAGDYAVFLGRVAEHKRVF